jgi:hypothetical protein
MLSKLGGFAAGSLISVSFVCNMDDIIYGQFRRNIINPFRGLIYKSEEKGVSLEDLMVLGEGTANFASQFKPHGLGRTNVKALLMNDENYSTP